MTWTTGKLTGEPLDLAGLAGKFVLNEFHLDVPREDANWNGPKVIRRCPFCAGRPNTRLVKYDTRRRGEVYRRMYVECPCGAKGAAEFSPHAAWDAWNWRTIVRQAALPPGQK